MEKKKKSKNHFDEQLKWNKRNEELSKLPVIELTEDDVPSPQLLNEFLNM